MFLTQERLENQGKRATQTAAHNLAGALGLISSSFCIQISSGGSCKPYEKKTIDHGRTQWINDRDVGGDV